VLQLLLYGVKQPLWNGNVEAALEYQNACRSIAISTINQVVSKRSLETTDAVDTQKGSLPLSDPSPGTQG
jgi:hypothetical protein